MKSTLLLVAALLAFATAVGCSSASSPSGSGATSLSSGTYRYDVTSAPTNTCWAPAKNTPALPTTVSMAGTVNAGGTTISFVTGTSGTGGVNVPVVLNINGTSLDGTTDTDADLNSNGLNCVLHIHATTTGTITGTDAFSAQNDINVTDSGAGPDCGFLVGSSVNPPQFDALPCHLVLQGTAAK